MTDRFFRLYIAMLATVFVVGTLFFAHRASSTAERAAENSRYQQIDYRMFSNDRVVSDSPSFYDTRTGIRGSHPESDGLAQAKTP